MEYLDPISYSIIFSIISKNRSCFYWFFIGWWITIFKIAILIYWFLTFGWAWTLIKRLTGKMNKPPKPKRDPEVFYTRVAGTNYKNDEGKSIQTIIKRYLKENALSNFELWTNKEILDEYLDIWEYDLEETNTIEFYPDPENKFDNTAIKIVHEEMGRVGYVPMDDKNDFLDFIDRHPNLIVRLKFLGGRNKFVDSYYNEYDEEIEKVVTNTRPYYLNIRLDEIVD